MPAPRPLSVPTSHHAEGPVHDPATGTLHWVDLTAGAVHHLHPDGRTSTDRYPVEITAVAPHRDGGLIAATAHGFAHLRDGTLTPLASFLRDRPGIRMNDGAVDPAGRFLAGSMAYDARPRAGALYQLDLDGTVRTLLDGVTIGNGIDWSPDGTTCYVTDSGPRTITAYDYDPATGALANPRVLLRFTPADGEPDGLTVDAEGAIWTALWDGWQIRRHHPDGTLLGTVDLPVRRPTSLAFTGPGLDLLCVTASRVDLGPAELERQPAAGGVLALRPGVTGRPAPHCRVTLPTTSTDRVPPPAGTTTTTPEADR
jgi:sugar lactone lactonase YvrE